MKKAVFVSLVFLILVITIICTTQYSNGPPERVSPKMVPKILDHKGRKKIHSNTVYNFDSYRNCLNDAYYENEDYKVFIKAYRTCIQRFIRKREMDKFRMGRFGEDKVFLPLKNSFDQQNECKWITVGIGGDDQVERLFKEKYPECKVYGIEASPDQYAHFDIYGTIIPFGVGVKNGSFDLTLRKGTSYKHQKVNILAFNEILDKFVKTRLIQYMTIDIEGFEFGILDELLKGKELDKQKIVFCQIDAELHSNKTLIRETLHKYDTEASQFLPIFTRPFFTHEKVTWINIGNEECRKAFNIEQFL